MGIDIKLAELEGSCKIMQKRTLMANSQIHFISLDQLHINVYISTCQIERKISWACLEILVNFSSFFINIVVNISQHVGSVQKRSSASPAPKWRMWGAGMRQHDTLFFSREPKSRWSVNCWSNFFLLQIEFEFHGFTKKLFLNCSHKFRCSSFWRMGSSVWTCRVL